MGTATLQEQFNTVVRGLAGQGWRQSRDPSAGNCLLRGPDGRKCAIGHLIPDPLYQKKMEGDVLALIEGRWAFSPEEASAVVDLLPGQTVAAEWQEMHDGCASPRGMLNDFIEWASINGVTWPEDVAQVIL